MSDPLDRDKFPDRPDTPEFWHLSEIVLANDANSDGVAQVVNQIIEVRVLQYVAMNRAGKACQALGLPDALEPMLAAAIMDGFAAGAMYERKYGAK
jgi:hypothetical protein